MHALSKNRRNNHPIWPKVRTPPFFEDSTPTPTMLPQWDPMMCKARSSCNTTCSNAHAPLHPHPRPVICPRRLRVNSGYLHFYDHACLCMSSGRNRNIKEASGLALLACLLTHLDIKTAHNVGTASQHEAYMAPGADMYSPYDHISNIQLAHTRQVNMTIDAKMAPCCTKPGQSKHTSQAKPFVRIYTHTQHLGACASGPCSS
jgi:hypothetical protein